MELEEASPMDDLRLRDGFGGPLLLLAFPMSFGSPHVLLYMSENCLSRTWAYLLHIPFYSMRWFVNVNEK